MAYDIWIMNLDYWYLGHMLWATLMSIELDYHSDVPKLGCAHSIREGRRGSE